MVGRFRKLKEEEKKKKTGKALPDDEAQALDSASASDEESDEETKDKVLGKKFLGKLDSRDLIVWKRC